MWILQEQQPVCGERDAQGAVGAGGSGQRGSEPGHPQAHRGLDQSPGGVGAEGVGLEERGGGERERERETVKHCLFKSDLHRKNMEKPFMNRATNVTFCQKLSTKSPSQYASNILISDPVIMVEKQL